MDRLIRLAIRLLMRHGMRRATKGQKPDPNMQRVQKSLRMANRIRRM